ncbi:AraC family transcriptional regulator [Paenimyroides tangerinum]|uniref:AraC family transcriptional regulator n=1 Tax=Paenimyroides tangerinum TaxID=2488728 RepID=A0A3P3W8Q1_9FLAO|nr:AraC family transcriptional regulator [Paenimyroides tangerinum]RRJ91542.1 AraC family transcriptional regulator [Paenimyroides tangerinum]
MNQISIQNISSKNFLRTINCPFYQILVFNGSAKFEINLIQYECSDSTILFLTPYQQFKWLENNESALYLIQFHGDYYCIEYHKNMISCNGILFNNIYEKPFFNINESYYDEIVNTIEKMENEIKNEIVNPFTDSIVKSYLQLILSISSKEKSKYLTDIKPNELPNKDLIYFQDLIEKYYKAERSMTFYAAEFSLSTDAFSKKVKKQFSKSPSQLINERVILEAKKLLHLTYKSIKEIAQELNFEDEFYFSRYFKKSVGVSPSSYRKNVGISIAAK